MNIYIPTRGRADNQITLSELPDSAIERTYLMVDYKERHMWSTEGWPKVVFCPEHIDTIGKVRQFIVHWHNRNKFGPLLLMLDDDLRFYQRRADQPDKFVDADQKDVQRMLTKLEKTMERCGYAHAGILAREGGNRITAEFKRNTRLLRALAYNVDVLRKHKVRFDRVTIMEDFDVALQLLRLGYPSVALCGWVHNQMGSGAKGGCSTYRTLELQADGAHTLASLHPEFVKCVEKTTKTAWGGATRTDVVVQWAKAYESSYKEEEHGNQRRA